MDNVEYNGFDSCKLNAIVLIETESLLVERKRVLIGILDVQIPYNNC